MRVKTLVSGLARQDNNNQVMRGCRGYRRDCQKYNWAACCNVVSRAADVRQPPAGNMTAVCTQSMDEIELRGQHNPLGDNGISKSPASMPRLAGAHRIICLAVESIKCVALHVSLYCSAYPTKRYHLLCTSNPFLKATKHRFPNL